MGISVVRSAGQPQPRVGVHRVKHLAYRRQLIQLKDHILAVDVDLENVATGSKYSVTVATQIPGQTCTVSGGDGAISAANVSTIEIACAPTTYTIGGTVSGLPPGASLVVSDNGADPLTVGSNGTFAFATPV